MNSSASSSNGQIENEPFLLDSENTVSESQASQGRGCSVEKTRIAGEWEAEARCLADWAFARLVMRRDVYGLALKDGKRITGHAPVSVELLTRHFRGEISIGFHPINPEHECKWMAFDVDAHDTAADVGINWQCVEVIASALKEFRLEPLICDSDGKGGYHVFCFLKKPIGASVAKWLGTSILARLQQNGLPKVEFFPKQDKITVSAPFGNWLRAPGKHHKRDHWTRLRKWDGDWLQGTKAIRLLVAQAGDDPSPLLQSHDQHCRSFASETATTRPRLARSGNERPDEARVRAALDYVRNSDVHYDVWLGVGMSLNDWDSVQGLPLWLEWSAQSRKHNESICRAKWNSFAPGGGLTIASIFDEAIGNGWDPKKQGHVAPSLGKSERGNLNGSRLLPCPRKVKLISFQDIKEEKVEWLWYPRLPLGMVTIFAGAPKVGKTFVTLGIAASVSRGAPLPLDGPRSPCSVIILSAEDDPARTLKPRLRAAGANMSRIHFLKSVILNDGSEALPSLLSDMEAIEVAAKDLEELKLIIIDPVTAFMDGMDDNANTKVRSVLFPLSEMAKRINAAMVLVTHVNKSSTKDAQQKVIGSIAYTAAARMNFLFTKHKDDPTKQRRLMLDNGCNLAAETPTLGYRIGDSGEGPAIQWEQDTLSITAEEALVENIPEEDHADKDEQQDCKTWLKEALRTGPQAARRVIDKAKDVGFPEKTVRRAKKALCVISDRSGFTKKASWKWRLPPEDKPFEDGQIPR